MVNLFRRRDIERAYLDALHACEAGQAPSPERRALALEALVEIDRLLDGLPGKVRKAFLLAQLEGLRHAEIADRMQVSVSSVRQYPAPPCSIAWRPGERARDGGARLARVGDTRGQRVVRAAGRGGRPARPTRPRRDWLAADARHRRAWARVEALGRQFGQVQARAAPGRAGTARSGGRRRALKISLAAGTGGLTAAGLPWRAWTSDLSAGIGQTRVATLDDGSLLTLNTGSAADVRFSDALRLIVLRQGELHIATYRDAMTPARPPGRTRRWVACSGWAPATWCACTTTASGWW